MNVLLKNNKKINIKQIKGYLKYKKTRKAKTVIYTAISGNYEKLKQHQYISKDFDYICFTDQKIKNPGIWEIVPLEKKILDLTRIARYHKIFPHILLKKYDYSVWIDSNIDVISNSLEKRIYQLIEKKEKIASCIHFERDCIYQEAKACIDQQKDEPETILKEVDFLKKENYPKNNGLFETNIIFRKHNDPSIIKLMEDWWKMILNFSKRDQLSFNYVLWKNKIKYKYIFPTNTRLMKDDFVFSDHNTKIVSTLFVDTKNKKDNNNFIQKIVFVSNNSYKVSFPLKEFKNIDQLRLNILKNKFCQFKIKKIKINDKKISLSKISFQANGSFADKGYVNFSNTSDPYIILKISENIKKISISGIIKMYNTESLYFETKQQKDQLQAELIIANEQKNQLQTDLNKIKSLKTYNLWQNFIKIKKKLKLK
jgi:hypothetical protein